MNIHDIVLLQKMSGYPALSIALPTHRTSPENRQDPIRLGNLVAEAQERLLAEFSKREIEPLLTRLDELFESIDYRSSLDGLVLFVNHELARVFYLPFSLKERVVVDENGLHISPAEEIEDPDVLDDAVDEVINIVLEKGGKVVFVENGQLEAHSRISLILRY